MLSPFNGCCGKSSYTDQTWCPYHDGRNNNTSVSLNEAALLIAVTPRRLAVLIALGRIKIDNDGNVTTAEIKRFLKK